jgi:hypothetical protein
MSHKREFGSYRKHFKRTVNLLIICERWCRWARHKYERNLQRFISFSQYHDPQGFGKAKRIDEFEDENARIRAEMMNFKATFRKTAWLGLDPVSKSILKKGVRQTADLEHVKNAFKNMPHMRHFNRLSSDMMDLILKSCWIEEYEAKRVIVEQYQRPAFFYIVLNGSLVCTYKSKEDRKSSTICFLEKGELFSNLFLITVLKSKYNYNTFKKDRS